MAEINPSLRLQSRNLQSLQGSLDPKSPIVSPFSDSEQPQLVRHTTENFIMERGPRFKEYSALRERKLRMKNPTQQQDRSVTPQRKQVKFSSDFTTPPRRPKITSVLTQSVPDFSSALRKENRKPPSVLRAVAERSVTPPVGYLKSARVYGKVGGGSKSTNSGEKRSGGLLTARKSYVNMEELKRLAVAAGKEINSGKFGREVGNNNKTVCGK